MANARLLLKAEEIERMEGVRRVHFLNPDAVRTKKSLGDAVGLEKLGVHLVEIEAGRRSTEFHKHYCEEECIFVLSGRGTLELGEDRFAIGPGDFAGLPAGRTAHSILNDGDEPLVCLVFGQRLPFDVADYPRAKRRLYRWEGRWDLVDLDAARDPRESRSG